MADRHPVSRRTFLATAAAASTVSVAGCTDLFGSDSFAWDGSNGDIANTRSVGSGHGPGEDLEVAWELTAEDIATHLEVDEDDVGEFIGTTYRTWMCVDDDLVVEFHRLQWLDVDNGGVDRIGTLVAYDATDGTVEWVRDLKESEERIRGPWLVNGDIAVNYDGSLSLFDPADGDLVDEVETQSVFDWPIATGDGLLVAPGEDTITVSDLESGDELWSEDVSRGDYHRTAVVDGTIVFPDRADRPYTALDAQTGEEVWTADVELPTSLVTERRQSHEPAVADDDRVLLAAGPEAAVQNDLGALIELDPDTGDTLARFRPEALDLSTVPEDEWTVPHLSHDQLLRRLDTLDEELASVTGLPLVLDDVVVARGYGIVDGVQGTNLVFAVDMDTEDAVWAIDLPATPTRLAAAGDTIYAAGGDSVWAISSDGEELDALEVTADDAVSADTLALQNYENQPVLTRDGMLVPTGKGVVGLE